MNNFLKRLLQGYVNDIFYAEQLMFIFVFGFVIYNAFHESQDSLLNSSNGVKAAMFVLVFEATLRTYDGPFLRPNKAFWRACLRVCVLYLCGLCYLVFQTEKDARQSLKFFYPELGQPISKEMHTYDDQCELTWGNVYDNMDHYYQIHLFNFFLATMITRNFTVMTIWSILIELLELSWQHVLPHFRECWWDHVIMDMLLSNLPATLFALFIIRITGLEWYDWFGSTGKKSIWEYKIFTCHRYFGTFCCLLSGISISFLTGFFMINGLWIPPKNFLNVFRLCTWFLLCNLTFREAYTDIKTWNTETRRDLFISGKTRFINCGILLLEVIVSWKFRKDAGNVLDQPTPLYILVPWVTVIISFICFYLYLRFKKGASTKYPIKEYKKVKNQ